jgi:hypothetical protein
MSYTDMVSPRKVQEAVQRGFDRLANFRNARVFFLREYAGAYYDRVEGEVGTAPLNLIFNAIRILVPTIVMNFPKHTIMTPYMAVREYANLLGLALDQHDMKIDVCNTYRRVIVDALFTLGIMKTGLAQSDTIYGIDDELQIDPGTVYTEAVDFDNFVVDPSCKDSMFRDAKFMGDKIVVPRKMLLDSGLYNNELIEQLPRKGDRTKDSDASELSMRNIQIDDNYDLEDDVEICEIWVPSANAIVTVPASSETSVDDYLRVEDYYGVKEGPYTILSLTPPMPGNPMPIPLVGVWYDLHVLANRMAKKIVEQAERQKDITTYKRAGSDDAEQLKNAGDGEAIAVDDPDNVKILSFGGQQNSNEHHLDALQGWFNMMAANPNQIGGLSVSGKTATAANILQQNASIGLEDMKDLVYKMAASEARKRAWYFHTDPLMKIPLVRRQEMQGPPILGPNGQPIMPGMPIMQDVQVILTPEARRGDFIDFMFKIEPESMGRVDSKVRLQQAMAFCQQIMPAIAAAAQIFMGMGIPFSPVAMMLRMAKDSGIEWMDEVLFDPQFQQTMQMQMMMGPQMAQSKGQPAQPNQGLMNGMLQNGQPGQVQGAPPGQGMLQHQEEQQGANEAQRALNPVFRHAFNPPAQKPALANANAF